MTTLQLIAAAWFLCGLSFVFGWSLSALVRRGATEQAYADGVRQGYYYGQDHVVLEGDVFRCLRCGHGYKAGLPCSINMLISMSKAFAREHRLCLPVDRLAEVVGATVVDSWSSSLSHTVVVPSAPAIPKPPLPIKVGGA